MMMMGANHLHLSIGKQANYQQPPTPEAKQKLVRDRYSLFMNLGSVVVCIVNAKLNLFLNMTLLLLLLLLLLLSTVMITTQNTPPTQLLNYVYS